MLKFEFKKKEAETEETEKMDELDEIFEHIKEDAKKTIRKMEKRNELVEKLEEVQKWHEETFPKAPLHGQLAKLEEELQEFQEAMNADDREKANMEMADVFIVIAGLRRWKSCVGAQVYHAYVDEAPIEILETLLKCIDKKMEINRERTKKGLWKVQPDGSSHH